MMQKRISSRAFLTSLLFLRKASSKSRRSQAKVTGLPDALAGKVDKVEGKGLSTNDFTDEAKAKLDGVEAGANQNLIEIVKLNGAALDISDENKVAVAEDGSMEVNSLNMSKLVQSEGDTLILDGGNASV